MQQLDGMGWDAHTHLRYYVLHFLGNNLMQKVCLVYTILPLEDCLVQDQKSKKSYAAIQEHEY